MSLREVAATRAMLGAFRISLTPRRPYESGNEFPIRRSSNTKLIANAQLLLALRMRWYSFKDPSAAFRQRLLAVHLENLKQVPKLRSHAGHSKPSITESKPLSGELLIFHENQ